MFTKVIGNRVLCAYPWKASDEITTKGGIIIPDAQKDKPNNLVVVLSGVNGINPGDRIVFNKYHGTTITLNDQEYIFFKEEEILGVIDASVFKSDEHNEKIRIRVYGT
jgi:chaperonin GroES